MNVLITGITGFAGSHLAEYILAEGNYNVILCERGIRTFADHTRNTLDLSVIPAVQKPMVLRSSIPFHVRVA